MNRPTPQTLARIQYAEEGLAMGLTPLDAEEYAEAMLATFGGHALVMEHAVHQLRDDLRATPLGRGIVRLADWLADHLPRRG